jgi:hypothetical protein
MLTSIMIMVITIIVVAAISMMHISVDQLEIDMWNVRNNNNNYWLHNKKQAKEWKKEKSAAIVAQHISEPVWDSASGDAEGAPGVTWHDQAAQQLLVATVWAYSVYAQRGGIAAGVVDPIQLDPRKLPYAEEANKMSDDRAISTLKFIHTCMDKLEEVYFTAKWNARQAYYTYKSDRAKPVAGRVHTMPDGSTGSTISTAMVPTYQYKHSVY